MIHEQIADGVSGRFEFHLHGDGKVHAVFTKEGSIGCPVKARLLDDADALATFMRSLRFPLAENQIEQAHKFQGFLATLSSADYDQPE